MNWTVRQIIQRLYGVEIDDAASVRAAYGGVMTSTEPFSQLAGPTTLGKGAKPTLDADVASLERFLLHALCMALERSGLFLQLLTGIEAGWGGGRVPVNDPHRILR